MQIVLGDSEPGIRAIDEEIDVVGVVAIAEVDTDGVGVRVLLVDRVKRGQLPAYVVAGTRGNVVKDWMPRAYRTSIASP